jgi:signal transduction histidine kinase
MMGSRSGEPTVDRLEAALAENASLRIEVETLRTERTRLQMEIRHAGSAANGGGAVHGTLHDFKNLLSVITGHSQLLLRRLEPADALWRSVDAIRKAADSGTALMQQLLDRARGAERSSETIDLTEIADGVARMLDGMRGTRVALVTRLDARGASVCGDATQLQQVAVNLVVNALDATPDGGTITIETANLVVPVTGSRAPDELRPGAYVTMTVRDSGPGMEPWVMARLFEPYFTTKGDKGRGLGLARVRQIVERHGGAITVTTAAGQGSAFRVSLPRLAGPAAVAGGAPAVEGGRETVLIVEDEPELLELVREILEQHGYQVLEAPDTDRGVEVARTHAGPIHLVITDVVVPGMGTWDFRAAITRSRPGTRLLYISGFSEHEIERRLGRIPGPILKKPFAVAALADRVREVLDAP